MSGEYWTSPGDTEGAARNSEEESDARVAARSATTMNRRTFLQLLGGAAGAALAGCARPAEKIIPYADQPPEMTPGVATWYATTCHGCSAGCGALVKVMDGRPIKLEGNPEHPVSRGGLCATGQASIRGLYDSDRARGPSRSGAAVGWDALDQELVRQLAQARQQRRKVVLLTGVVNGPAARAAIGDFLAAAPPAEHVIYESTPSDALRDACATVLGEPMLPTLRFDKADVIVSFGADFLGSWWSPVEFTKQYSSGRDPDGRPSRMSRHFQFESRLSLTGANADLRQALAPSERPAYVAALLAQVAAALPGTAGGWWAPLRGLGQAALAALPADGRAVCATAAAALLRARGRSLVLSDANDHSVQVAILALNYLLGNLGQTMDLTRLSNQRLGSESDLVRLVDEMQRGEVAVLLVHGCNPVYTYPQPEAFAGALRRVGCSVALGHTLDETGAATTWHCATDHPMESWGDAEPQTGRFGLFQPTIRPLFGTRSFHDCLLRWTGRNVSFHDYLQQYWQAHVFPGQQGLGNPQASWETVLQRGFLEVPASPQAPPRANIASVGPALQEMASRLRGTGPGLESEVFEPVALRDGTAANNPWLQELPDPTTKITWDNCALVAPALARQQRLVDGQVVELTAGGRTLKLPARIQPGQHARVISVALGYGRTRAGRVAEGVGVNAYPLMSRGATGRSMDSVIASLRALGGIVAFAQTQIHTSQEGRPLVHEAVYGQSLRAASEQTPPGDDLWSEHQYGEYRWGMVIDLTRCTGCSACVVACDLENNVPVVGRDEVRVNREMHWLRLDRYYVGSPDAPRVVHQPMLCQHCDRAPCETVCPVLATVHDNQGLSIQTYNRCVGTRYCANNCPYKVRRFNFFSHLSRDVVRNLGLNPDVTVRSRGVMEKCSMCLQRIQRAKIAARREGRKLADGEVQTACQQTCPANAITFGNIADRRSRVSLLSASPRIYSVLADLGRRPVVRYLTRIRNTGERVV